MPPNAPSHPYRICCSPPCVPALNRYAFHNPRIHRIHDCQPPSPHTTSTAGGTLCLANNVSYPCSHTSASLSRQEIHSNRAENIFPEKNPSPLYPPSSHSYRVR